MGDYRTRLLDPLLQELSSELPALLLAGPRATGKTTTAARHARTTVRLDRDDDATAFRADPDAALASLAEPVLLDEWQAVPEVLGAVKRSVDADPSPGRFLLTGSVRADLDSSTWPGTGRVVQLRLLGMTVTELEQTCARHTPLLDRLAAGETIGSPRSAANLTDYIELLALGGFPSAALNTSPRARTRWLDSYVEQLVTRDASQVSEGRDPERLRRFFEAYALNTAGVVADKTLYEAAQIDRRTAGAYEQLLKNLFVVESTPAWSSNRIKRLVKAPKRHLIDPALATALLRIDPTAILRDGNLLGRLLETFVVSQIRGELENCESRPRLFHLRAEEGRREIDLIAELGGGRILGIEVKASAAPKDPDARHLAWLRDALGERFVAGVVFHTGPRVFPMGDRIQAVPICCLWQ